MRGRSVIPYLDTCTHLRNILCTSDKHVMIDSAVKDLNCRLNNLLADFSHCNNNTLSTLFNSYCMNVYGCQLWKLIGKHNNTFFCCMEKSNTKNLEDSFLKSYQTCTFDKWFA